MSTLQPFSCPICGQSLGGGNAAHQCPRRTIAAINAAHARDPDDEESPAKPWWKRHRDGNAIRQLAGDGG